MGNNFIKSIKEFVEDMQEKDISMRRYKGMVRDADSNVVIIKGIQSKTSEKLISFTKSLSAANRPELQKEAKKYEEYLKASAEGQSFTESGAESEEERRIYRENDFFALQKYKDVDDIKGFDPTVQEGVLNANKKKFNTFIIRDKRTKEVVGVYSINVGTVYSFFLNTPINYHFGVEIRNFAVKQKYEGEHMHQLLAYLFYEFPFHMIRYAELIWGKYFIIYTSPDNKYLSHYETFGFSRIPDKKLEEKVCAQNHRRGCMLLIQPIHE